MENSCVCQIIGDAGVTIAQDMCAQGWMIYAQYLSERLHLLTQHSAQLASFSVCPCDSVDWVHGVYGRNFPEIVVPYFGNIG